MWALPKGGIHMPKEEKQTKQTKTMLPGNPQVLTCPFCGEEKEIMSLMSGNTFNAQLWSDNKQIAPMLPEVSYIQKCPHCGKYYILSRQKTRYKNGEPSFDLGTLTYQETKEAFAQLAQDCDDEEELSIRMMLHHAYNDHYHRSDKNPEIQPEDWELFVSNARWIINDLTSAVIKAEFYREIGEFDQALSVLDSRERADNAFLEHIAKMVREKAENKDNRVFRIR